MPLAVGDIVTVTLEDCIYHEEQGQALLNFGLVFQAFFSKKFNEIKAYSVEISQKGTFPI